MSPYNFGTPSISNRQNVRSVIDSNLKNQKRQLVLGIETTGFFPTIGDRIVEIGIVELINRQLTGNLFHVYLNPECPVGRSEYRHRLSDVFLSTKPLFMDIADELESFIIGAEVIAHDARLVMQLLDAEMQKSGRKPLTGRIDVIDSLAIIKKKFPRQVHSLDALVKRFNVKQRKCNFHSALLSAGILVDVYLILTNEATNGRYESTELNQDSLYGRVQGNVIETRHVDAAAILRFLNRS